LCWAYSNIVLVHIIGLNILKEKKGVDFRIMKIMCILGIQCFFLLLPFGYFVSKKYFLYSLALLIQNIKV